MNDEKKEGRNYMIYAQSNNKAFIVPAGTRLKKVTESKKTKKIRKAIEAITVQEEPGTYTFNFTKKKSK